jgi:hypothetical protein
VPQERRRAGTYRRLAKLMAGLGWTAVRVRGLTRGGYLVANHARKPLDIPRKSRFTVVSSSVIHLSPQADVNLNKN